VIITKLAQKTIKIPTSSYRKMIASKESDLKQAQFTIPHDIILCSRMQFAYNVLCRQLKEVGTDAKSH